MRYQTSHTLLWIGLIAGLIAGFFSVPAGGSIIALAVLQALIFYRCPHCHYCLFNIRGLPSCCPMCGEDLF